MGIQVEFNPDLALRNFSEFKNGNRKKEECLPEKFVVGEIHNFLKKGQRNYWLFGEIPLRETKGNQQLSKPLASAIILEATHFVVDNEIWTKGKYKIVKVILNDEIYFNGLDKN